MSDWLVLMLNVLWPIIKLMPEISVFTQKKYLLQLGLIRISLLGNVSDLNYSKRFNKINLKTKAIMTGRVWQLQWNLTFCIPLFTVSYLQAIRTYKHRKDSLVNHFHIRGKDTKFGEEVTYDLCTVLYQSQIKEEFCSLYESDFNITWYN